MADSLVVGTAGHIDHGKTALVHALSGVDTDRLPEERARGMTIVLGFAPLWLPSGRRLSLIDVPGHERLVRVMVSGATGIDMYLLVIAADDGVMPQTTEHIRVLDALGVRDGVVAVTKSDLADPAPALEQAHRLLPGAELASCSARTGFGVAAVAAALDRVAARRASRATGDGAAVLHVDRTFTIRGAGTVVTGTLWAGRIGRGDHLRLLPAGTSVRVRGVQVHDAPVEGAEAGQRVAVNLAGVERRAVVRGDVLVGPGAPVHPSYRIEARLALHEPLAEHERVQVHHGTRDVPARAVSGDAEAWQLRLERPLLVADGDRIVIRRISPAGTLGGGVITRARAGGRRHALDAARPGRRAAEPAPPQPSTDLDPDALALEERLRAAGATPPAETELGEDARHLAALRSAGRAVRVGRAMYAHVDAVAAVRSAVERVVLSEGSITLARLRDELGITRRYAQAFLEHLDAARVTRRLPDDSRVLRRAAQEAAAGSDGVAPSSSSRS